jgi:hypothetical protein
MQNTCKRIAISIGLLLIILSLIALVEVLASRVIPEVKESDNPSFNYSYDGFEKQKAYLKISGYLKKVLAIFTGILLEICLDRMQKMYQEYQK